MLPYYQSMLAAAPVPQAINGLIVYLNGQGGLVPKGVSESAHDQICMGGGTPELVNWISQMAAEFGLAELDDKGVYLTDRGTTFANSGGKQGPGRWELSTQRRAILLDQWRARAGAGIFAPLEEALNLIIEGTSIPQDSPYRNAIRFLEGLTLLTTVQGKTLFTPDAAKLLRQLSTTKASSPVTVPDEPARVMPPTSWVPVQNERNWIEDSADRLNQAGFRIGFEELVNLYICAKSSYLTVLAGPPGSGKSTLVRRVADVLGHRPSLLEVTVRRGWTDDHAFTGAVNRLHQRYDPSPTGVADHLLSATRNTDALHWMLLDEFNLSTPEYYFAEFISALESDSPRLQLFRDAGALSNAADYPAQIPLSPNLHIFGTINLDETSQPLSPRLIDRANFIWVERHVGLEILESKAMPPAQVGPASARQVSEWLRPASIEGEERQVLKEILDHLATKNTQFGASHLTSPRAILAVAQYVANGAGLLSARTALDLAVAQRILPGLRGFGDKYGKRLEKLRDLINNRNMPRSCELLNRVLSTGADRGHEYDFIATLW